MRVKYEDLLSKDYEYEKITSIEIINQAIYNFDILYKCINIKELKINFCHFDYKDYLNFDFSKFKKLNNLTITNNYFGCCNYNESKFLDKLVNKFGYPKEIFRILINCYHSKKIFIAKINKDLYLLNKYIDKDLRVNDLELKFRAFIIYLYEIEKEFYENKIEKILESPFNQSIFNCKIKELTIDNCKIKEFFNKLPDECELLNYLNNLIILDYINDTPYYQDSCVFNTDNFYMSNEEHRHKYLFDVANVEIDKDICKFALFKNLKSNIFDFIKSDYRQFICRKKPKGEDGLINNIILYYKNKCYVHLIFNKIIEFKEDITDLRIIIDKKDYAFENKFKENILCLNALPYLKKLQINCFHEHYDGLNTIKYSTNLKLENSPQTLENLKITGIDEECISKIKIPFGCKVIYRYMKKKN
jgi:hypothetical protein